LSWKNFFAGGEGGWLTLVERPQQLLVQLAVVVDQTVELLVLALEGVFRYQPDALDGLLGALRGRAVFLREKLKVGLEDLFLQIEHFNALEKSNQKQPLPPESYCST
jgi:hypothetical protein